MHKLTLSAALSAILLGSSVAGAGVVGTLSIASHLAVTDPTPAFLPEESPQTATDGRLPVRLRAVSNGGFSSVAAAEVTFTRNGQSVLRTNLVDGGSVPTDGLSTGAYSVFVNGADGFAAFSTMVAPNADTESAESVISVGLVPKADMPTVRRLIESRRTTAPAASDSPYPVSTRTFTSSRSLTHGSGLELSADGTLQGRAVHTDKVNDQSLPIAGASVYFVGDNQVLAESLTDADGLFMVRGLAAGVYSLVITAEDAFVALSVEVSPASTPLAGETTVNELSLVSIDHGNEVPEVSLVYGEDCHFVEECIIEECLIEEELVEETPCCGGGASGGGYGGGGGGGGGFGGGGLGALLGGAALGAAIYAIADDDDDNNKVVSPLAP